MKFFTQLFSTDRRETKGQILFFSIFEVVVIYQVLFYAWEWAFYIPQLGDVVLPLGIANYIDISFMFNPGYALANAALITFFALLGFIRKERSYYALALLGMHLQYVARFSQGEISHGSNLSAMALLMLALAGIFFSERSHQRKVAMGLFIFFTGLGYTSAAICKLVATGPEWINGSHLFLWISERATDKLSQEGHFELNFLQQIIFEHSWMATMTLLFGLLTEFLGFLLWFRKTRWAQATLLIGMHLGIALSMRIEFNSYLVLLFLIGYPWGKVLDYLMERVPQLESLVARRLFNIRQN